MNPSEKLVSLQRYLEKTTHQLNGAVPERRKNQAEQYKDFLKLEIKRTQAKIDALKLVGPNK